jgi:signal transduction histidine kinase
VLIVDNSLLIADYNNAFRKLIHAGNMDFIGMKVNELVPHRAELIQTIVEQGDYQTEFSSEIEGELRYFDFQATTIYDHHKERTGCLIMMKDITHHVLAERKISEANDRLTREIVEKEKLIDDLDAFSHTVAHDLQNMLGSIVGASELIQSNFDSLQKEELLEINHLIHASASKTIQITKELLTLASVRQEDVKPQTVDMGKIIRDSVERLSDMTEKSSEKIQVADTWPMVWGNEAWLEEVWINFISNAIKYGGTPPAIHIGWDKVPGNKAIFWIEDNGNGISEGDIKKLYSKFTRLEAHQKVEGNGLGLSIVKRIVEKLNGEVGVESANIPGEGSKFYFILPLAE